MQTRILRIDVKFAREGILRTIYRLQSQRQSVSILEIAEQAECGTNTVRRHIKPLVMDGYVEVVPGSGRGSAPARYRIAPLGKRILSIA